MDCSGCIYHKHVFAGESLEHCSKMHWFEINDTQDDVCKDFAKPRDIPPSVIMDMMSEMGIELYHPSTMFHVQPIPFNEPAELLEVIAYARAIKQSFWQKHFNFRE